MQNIFLALVMGDSVWHGEEGCPREVERDKNLSHQYKISPFDKVNEI
jgi:hypothetical protein